MRQRSSRIEIEEGWARLPCVCANVRRLARLATHLYDEELRPAGMEVGQFGLTATIGRLGEVTQGQLARMLAIDSTSLTRTLAVLQKRGWIERRVGDDRRTRLFAITRAGEAQLALARPYWLRAQQRVAETIGGPGVDALLHAVEHASVALQDERRPPAPADDRRAR